VETETELLVYLERFHMWDNPQKSHPLSEDWWWQHYATAGIFIGRAWEFGQIGRRDGW